MNYKHKFFIGKPPGYPIKNLKELTIFGNSLEKEGINFEIILGGYKKEIEEANVDSLIIASLTGNILIPTICSRYYIPKVNNIVTDAISLQSSIYAHTKTIFIFSGDEDFTSIAQQIRHYTSNKIKVHLVSHPSIINKKVRKDSNFINIDELLSPSFSYEKEGNLLIFDGNNFLNALSINLISHREDYGEALKIIKQINSKLGGNSNGYIY